MTRRHIYQRLLDVALFAATMAAVAASFIDGLPDWATLAALLSFVVMFFIRWRIDDDRKAWMKSNWFDLALVVLLSSPILRMLMALKVAGLAPALKIGTMIRSNRERLLKLVVLSGDSLPVAMALVFGLVFVFGTAVFMLEHGKNPQFHELQDGLWWAFVTLTTVGYGDMVPISGGGRMVAVLTMLFGIAVYSLVIANLTAFVEAYRDNALAQQAENSQDPAPQLSARKKAKPPE
ncbi:MAG: ion channel [Mariprofundaceae bacterium]|nr:ion channel [Mariprofundaceae bacterium]